MHKKDSNAFKNLLFRIRATFSEKDDFSLDNIACAAMQA